MQWDRIRVSDNAEGDGISVSAEPAVAKAMAGAMRER